MRKTYFTVVLAAAVALTGCAHKRSPVPDEFAVARNAPLIIPPNFNLAPQTGHMPSSNSISGAIA